MTIYYRIMRSDQTKFDLVKVQPNDIINTTNVLTNYFNKIDKNPDYISQLALWSLHNNAPCGYYKNILRYETPNHIEIIVQVKRQK